MKTEVYSWRVSTDVKTGLEREARRRKLSVSAVLDLAARDWLIKARLDNNGDEEQARLQKAARSCFGAFAGNDTRRSENTRALVRARLIEQHAR